ncbi:unnamed protein product [Urochloa humidicola]
MPQQVLRWVGVNGEFSQAHSHGQGHEDVSVQQPMEEDPPADASQMDPNPDLQASQVARDDAVAGGNVVVPGTEDPVIAQKDMQKEKTPEPTGDRVNADDSGNLSGAATDFVASGGLSAEKEVSSKMFGPQKPPLQPSVPLKVLVDDPPRVLEELSDVEILDRMPASTKPRKRRGKKKRGPLDTFGLRRSLRLKRSDGFRDEASAAKAKATVAHEASTDEADEVVEEPVPLETVLPDSALIPYQAGQADPSLPVAPHLPTSLLQSIGEKFLKMPPKVVSDDLLMASSDDE